MRIIWAVSFALVFLAPGAVAQAASPNDYSGNGLHLTVQDTPTTVAAPIDKWGLGYRFDGSNDCLRGNLQAGDRTTNVTYYSVMRLTGANSGTIVQTAPTQAGQLGKGFGLGLAATGSTVRAFVQWGINSGTYQVMYGNTSLTLGDTVSVAGSFNTVNKAVTLYVNGRLDNQVISSTQISWTDGAGGPTPAQFYIGATRDNTAGANCNISFIAGDVFEVRTWPSVIESNILIALTDPDDCTYAQSPVGGEFRVYLLDDLAEVECIEIAPLEFDSGMLAFFSGLGFRSQNSLTLLAIILVGFVVVCTAALTKWFSPSRVKNYTIAGIAIMSGIFAGLLFNVQIWQLTISLVMGLFVVRGAGEVRNTFSTVREAVGKLRGQPETKQPVESPPEAEKSTEPEQEQTKMDEGVPVSEPTG